MNKKNINALHKEKIEGKYVNFFKVGYNADVFVIDYYQIFPEDNETEASNQQKTAQQFRNDPKCRIITSPSDAKNLMEQLKLSIIEYEKDYKNV